MNVALPKYLYRGDGDPKRIRHLRETVDNSGYLLTNLSSGGNPMEIFNAPLIQSIDNHAAKGWTSSHYLSFSESLSIAEKYARGSTTKKLVACGSEWWDSAVCKLNTEVFSEVRRLEIGVYECWYPRKMAINSRSNFGHNASAPQDPSRVPVLLIDLVSQITRHYSMDGSLGEALDNATRDSEWLILPIDAPYGDPAENVGLTACLDFGCIAEIKNTATKHEKANGINR